MINTPKVLFVSAMLAWSGTSLYASGNTEMVKNIMKLRADVEGLYSKIDENKENYKSQMKSYAMQLADNEAQVNRKETAIKVAEDKIKKLEEKIAAKGAASDDLKPMLEKAIENLKQVIAHGFPFKREERIAELEKIKTELEKGDITQEKALSLVWASYDDALRMTKEIGLFKQQIKLGGEEKLAKVAKIGTVMMFFKTPDGQVGYVTNNNGRYKYVVADDSKSKEQIEAIFDALQKQIRTGYFNLPNALVAQGVK